MAATDASQQANRAGMDPKRLVVIAFLVFAIIIGMFLGHLFGMLLVTARPHRRRADRGLGHGPAPGGLGFVVSIGHRRLLGVWSSPRVHTLATSRTATELMRVTWPSWEETRISTVAVVVASLVAAFVLFGIDTLSYKMMVEWLNRPSVGKL